MLKNLLELFTLVLINLKVRYRQTFIGFVWVLANPILLFCVQTFLFSHILQKSGPDYYLYLFSGLLPWFFLTQTAEMGCAYLLLNSQIMRNLKIHPYKLIWSLALENFLNFLCYSSIIFMTLYFSFQINWTDFVVYLVFSLWLLFLVANLTFVVSLLHILFKDTRYILHFIFTILYFLTPSFYYIENIPDQFRFLVKLNPFYWIITLFRLANTQESIGLTILINLFFTVTITLLAFTFWKKYKASVYLKL